MKKLLRHALLFTSPLALLLALEIFVLPINAFNYRGWEALSVYSFASNQRLVVGPGETGRRAAIKGQLNRLLTLPGPFYPDMRLTMTEQGDLGFYTSHAREKEVEWITDRYGFRVADRDGPWDVVIIGDSFVVCPGVTQNETLAAALARATGLSVYPYTFSVPQFLREQRFRDHPPSVIVLATVERNLTNLTGLPDPATIAALPPPAAAGWRTWPLVKLDRLRKASMWRFVRAGVRRFILRVIGVPEPLSEEAVPGRGGMLFLRDSGERAPGFSEINEMATQVQAFTAELRPLGIKVIVMPIPEKSSVYPELLDPPPPPGILPELTYALAQRGVAVVNPQPAFAAARSRGEEIYFSDDSHWNARGIAIAAELLAREVRPPDADAR